MIVVVVFVAMALVVAGAYVVPLETRRRRHARTLANISRLERELGIAQPERNALADRWLAGVQGHALSYRQRSDAERRGHL